MAKIVTVSSSGSTKYIRAGIFIESIGNYTLVDEGLKHYDVIFLRSYHDKSFHIMMKIHTICMKAEYTVQDIENHICFVGAL